MNDEFHHHATPACVAATMRRRGASPGPDGLIHEAWRVQVQTYCGRFNPEGIEPQAFVGQADHRTLCGLDALDLACNAERIERTPRDVRLDGHDHYFAVLQIAGRSAIAQNDDVIALEAGDVVLGDAARPVTFLSNGEHAHWFALHLPRRSLLTHLGFEPRELHRRNYCLPAQLLFQMATGCGEAYGSESARSDIYMNLAIYDLLGALFAPADPHTTSAHADRLFARLCEIIKGHIADVDLSPTDVAAEAGISLRYLQKLFAGRGLSCNRYIQEARLDHAARLLRRIEVLGTTQPLTEIAYASGFRDYPHFSRSFSDRFGHSPSAHTDAARSAEAAERNEMKGLRPPSRA